MLRKVICYVCLVSVVFLMAGMGEVCAQGLDSLEKAGLNRRLEEYFEALKFEDIEVQKAECDFLIGTPEDSSVRNHIAQRIYDHYIGSKIMGAEAVAVHVFDRWFLPGKVKFDDESEMFAARIFAEFNRQSLIGMKAPELSMRTPEGKDISLFGPDDVSGRFRVLYFYDTDCAKCRVESILLANVLETEGFPVNVIAVYVGDDRQEWERYIQERLTLEGGMAEIIHLWDPQIDSDYQRKYGVLQTPKMFLVAPDGTIIGRGLDAQALSQLLHGIFDEVELEYGGKESEALFDGIFMSGGSPTAEDVAGIADYIVQTTLPKGDTLMFRQLSGDLLYYLATHSGEGFKEGMRHHIDANITARPEVWRSHDDSLKVTGFASIMYDLLSKSVPGTLIEDIKVSGELHTWKKSVPFDRSLRKIRGQSNIIMFVTDGCQICASEKRAAFALLSADRRTKVLIVNIDEVMKNDPALASRLFDSFDLSALPFIIMTDKRGTIKRRYLSLQ